MKKVLITGASGFLGYNLCHDLGEVYRIFTTHHKTKAPATAAGSIQWDMTGSFKPLDNWISANHIDVVIHCAALSKPGLCSADPQLAHIMNVDATRELGLIAAKHKITMIFVSTDLVYNSGAGPHKEDEADPYLLYSETKFDAEMKLFTVYPSSIVLRSGLMYGSYHGSSGSFLHENDKSLTRCEHIKLFIDQYRSPVWSRDIANAVHRIISMGLKSQIYNIGGSTRINRYDLGMMAADVFNWDQNKILPVPMDTITKDAAFLKDCSLDSARLEKETGWKATSLADSLKVVASEWATLQ